LIFNPPILAPLEAVVKIDSIFSPAKVSALISSGDKFFKIDFCSEFAGASILT
jgi:hypothetical protein